jgi:hypothetical protein
MAMNRAAVKEADELLKDIDAALGDVEEMKNSMAYLEERIHDFIDNEHYDEDTKAHFEVIVHSYECIKIMLDLTQSDVLETLHEKENE